MNDAMSSLRELRQAYNRVKHQLPWLDISRWPDDAPAFPKHARRMLSDAVNVKNVQSANFAAVETWAGQQDVQAIRLLRSDDEREGGGTFETVCQTLVAVGKPLILLHTDVSFDEIRELAERHPKLTMIIESGPRKLLYHVDACEKILKNCGNVFLSTYNLCNWLVFEDFHELGLSGRLLFGTHGPRYNEDVAMGPIALADIPWKAKCDIAGGNLRRLLGLHAVEAGEIPLPKVSPFVIDAHAHSLRRDQSGVYNFPTPDVHFDVDRWLRFMDDSALDRLFLTPGDVLFDSTLSSKDRVEPFVKADDKRFFYFEMFNPTGDQNHIETFKRSLSDPSCIGIKIHPSTHKVEADDNSYDLVYQIARGTGKPIMTHSWDVSDYNPVQYMSHPDRFRTYFERYPDVSFVLGHAGGRPGAFEAVKDICSEFPQVRVDISGDYFDSGLLEALSPALGVEKILFGTDIDWIDPRCNLAAVLGSKLSDDDAMRILRTNALETYGSQRAL